MQEIGIYYVYYDTSQPLTQTLIRGGMESFDNIDLDVG